MAFVRRYTAPVSVVLLIIVAGIAFATLRTGTANPDPILDPNFALWVENGGQSRPMIWQFESVKTQNDLVWLNKTEAGGVSETTLHIFRNDRTGWSYAYLSQSIDGQRLTALFTMDVSISVMKSTLVPQVALFGVEVNDGLHVLTFIFSDQPAEPQQSLGHRTVFLQTQPNSWVNEPLDFAGQYAKAEWPKPDKVTLSIVFGAGPNAVGLQTVHVRGFIVSQPKSTSTVGYFGGFLACRIVE